MTTGRSCSVEECHQRHEARGFCNRHYLKWKKHGHPLGGKTYDPGALCRVEGCERSAVCQSRCQSHYDAWRKYGRDDLISDEQRFWAKVRLTDDETDCWEWQGCRTPAGYGKVQWRGCTRPATHAAVELQGIAVPPGGEVLHSCDNPPCVNPAHLRVGDHLQNMQDMVDRARSTRGRRNPRAVLCEDDVREIRRASAEGEAGAALARRFNVSPQTIYAVINRTNWGWLT